MRIRPTSRAKRSTRRSTRRRSRNRSKTRPRRRSKKSKTRRQSNTVARFSPFFEALPGLTKTIIKNILYFAGFYIIGKAGGAFVTTRTSKKNALQRPLKRAKMMLKFLIPGIPAMVIFMYLFDFSQATYKHIFKRAPFFESLHIPSHVYSSLVGLTEGIVLGIARTSKRFSQLALNKWQNRNTPTIEMYLPYHALAKAVYKKPNNRHRSISIVFPTRSFLSNVVTYKYDRTAPNTSELAFYTTPGEVVISIRGSKTADDWVRSDVGINMGIENALPRFERNVKEVRAAIPLFRGKQVVIVGHSLGGSVAHYVAHMTDADKAIGFASGFNLIAEGDMLYSKYGTNKSGRRRGCGPIPARGATRPSACKHINFTIRSDIIGVTGNRFISSIGEDSEILKKTYPDGVLHISLTANPPPKYRDYLPYYHDLWAFQDVMPTYQKEYVYKKKDRGKAYAVAQYKIMRAIGRFPLFFIGGGGRY